MAEVAKEKESEGNTLHGAVLILATIGLSLATFMFVLDYTICNVAIPYIAGGLATSVDEGTYVLTFFSVGNAVFLPLTGWLAQRFGEIKTLFWAVMMFTFFSFLCGLAPSLFTLVVFRFCQGAAAGPLVPLAQSVLTKIYPRNKLNGIMIIFSMIILVAPVLGPIVGGYFCTSYDWRWIFYINVPIGIFCSFIIWSCLNQLDKGATKASVDYISFFLLLVGMTALQLMLDKGEQWNWLDSGKIQICLVLTVVCLTYLVVISLLGKKPLLKLKIFGINKAFSLACILIATMYSLYMGTVVVVPLWLQLYQNYNALWAGIAVAPIGIGAVICAPLVGQLIPKIGRMPPIILGLVLMGSACLYSTNYYPEYSLYQVMVSRFFLGLGVGCWIVPVIGMPAAALSDENLSDGLGIFHFIRVISGAIGISVFSTLFKRRTIHQHFNVISNFNEYLPHAREYMHQIYQLGFRGQHAKALANAMVDQQAASLGFDEVSMFMVWMCVAMLILSVFAIRWERDIIKQHKAEGKKQKQTHVRLE